MTSNTCSRGHEFHMLMWGECPVCQGERNRRSYKLTAEATERLRAAVMGEEKQSAQNAADELTELGHPDVHGLWGVLKTRAAEAKAREEKYSKSKTAPKRSNPSWLKDE